MNRALIVSAGQNSNEYLARHLSALGYKKPVIVASGSEARRTVETTEFQVVVINSPLPDEYGHEVGIFLSQKTLAGVILLSKAGVLDEAADRIAAQGVLILPKPFSVPQFYQCVRLAASCSNRLHLLQADYIRLQDKLQQLRMVDRAKCFLIEKKGMTEADAHRMIEKEAMDSRRTRGEVAEAILEAEGTE